MVHSIGVLTSEERKQATYDAVEHMRKSVSYFKNFRETYIGWEKTQRDRFIAELFGFQDYVSTGELKLNHKYCAECSMVFFGVDLRLCKCRNYYPSLADLIVFLPGGPTVVQEDIYEDGLPDISLTFDFCDGSSTTTYVPQLLVLHPDVKLPLLVDDDYKEIAIDNTLEQLSSDIAVAASDEIANANNLSSFMFSAENRVQIYDIRNTLKDVVSLPDPSYLGYPSVVAVCDDCDSMELELLAVVTPIRPVYVDKDSPVYDSKLAGVAQSDRRYISIFNYRQLMAHYSTKFGSHLVGKDYIPSDNFIIDYERAIKSIKKKGCKFRYIPYNPRSLKLAYFIYSIKCFMESIGLNGNLIPATNHDVFGGLSLDNFRCYVNGDWDSALLFSLIVVMNVCPSLEEMYHACVLQSYGLTNADAERLYKFVETMDVSLDYIFNLISHPDVLRLGYLSRDYRWTSIISDNPTPWLTFKSLVGWDLLTSCSNFISVLRGTRYGNATTRVCYTPRSDDLYSSLAVLYTSKLLVSYYTHRKNYLRKMNLVTDYIGFRNVDVVRKMNSLLLEEKAL